MIAWHPHPDVWALITVLVGAYWWALRRGPGTAGRGQIALYAAGVSVLWLSSDWPMHELSEEGLYSVHMTQHILMAFVAPPLLLAGTPDWMWRRFLGTGLLRKVAGFVTRPVIALVIFNAVIAAIHAPSVVDMMIRSEVWHFMWHAAVVVTAVCMWSPVLTPLIDMPRLSHPGRMIYLFLQSLVPTVPASFLTFGSTILYKAYADLAPQWGVSALTDQRVAGLMMKLVGGAILWGFISVYFFRWFAMEDREGVDVVELGRMSRELTTS